ncbi:MAG: Gfo/Idh/MocA family oxidoreductase [Phycisphaerales bacterium]|nr:Gfo/Idh/MocA family oxidoreductase [Phycisphaerales bacterium]
MSQKSSRTPASRRDFLKAGAIAAAAASLTGCASAGKGGAASDKEEKAPAFVQKLPQRIRVGLIGAGGRGTGAAIDCAVANPEVEIVAIGDLFQDRVSSSLGALREKLGERCKATEQQCFTGFDNYRHVLATDCDLVILATPPGFRPAHFAAAVEAKKHVFMEKPVAVDPVGARSIIASGDKAREYGLGVVCGTQRRHQRHYLEAMKRVHGGDIGEIVAAQCYWNQEGLWVRKKEPAWSDMEWQCRNWLYFSWLSGDHIVEQHVHNLDAVNWALRDATPVRAVGMGGRQWRTAPEYGNIWDHFAVEYEYENGVRVTSMCRQIDKTSSRVSERIVGTKGVLRIDSSNAEITGARPWKYEGPSPNPYEVEHADLVRSIREGRPLNEARRIAESTLTAIMGRMSAYTGRELQWSWLMNSSKLDLAPPKLEMGDLPVGEIPMPGVTALV